MLLPVEAPLADLLRSPLLLFPRRCFFLGLGVPFIALGFGPLAFVALRVLPHAALLARVEKLEAELLRAKAKS